MDRGIEPDPVTEAESDPVSGLLKAAGEDLVRLSRLRAQEAADLQARSHVAANHATRMRQWARDHPVSR